MPKNTQNTLLTRQKRTLLLLEWSVGFRPAGSVWVLLLALRGFSLVEIGAAEGLFHVVSFCCELPSGLLADLLGRKRTLALSQGMFLLSALLMAGSQGVGGVYLSLAVSALGYNLQSGTREAMTYESMLQWGQEGEYLRFSSLQNGVYRFSDGGAMLLAGATVLLGWRKAYLLDAVIALTGLLAVLALAEPACPGRDGPAVTSRTLPAALRETVWGAWTLLKTDRAAVKIILVNALAGACATLTRFFLQQRVEAAAWAYAVCPGAGRRTGGTDHRPLGQDALPPSGGSCLRGHHGLRPAGPGVFPAPFDAVRFGGGAVGRWLAARQRQAAQ